MKVVINKCYGGFSISKEAFHWLGLKWDGFGYLSFYNSEEAVEEAKEADKKYPSFDRDREGYNLRWDMEKALGITIPEESWHIEDKILRTAPRLIECVEELDDVASGGFARLKIVEIPDGVEFEIEEYDGMEWIAEKHKTWG